MAVIAKINTGSNIGQVKLTQQTRSTIAAQNFKPKPNVALIELTDVNTVGVEDGFVLSYSSATNKYETQSIANVTLGITQISGGTF
jgi:hypothetical protein